MSEKKTGAFTTLLRKAVGLPTGNSSCCSGAPTEANTAPAKAETSGGCCSSDPAKQSKGGCCN